MVLDGLASLVTAVATVGPFSGRVAPVARLHRRARRLMYSDDEIMLLNKALLLSRSKQDAREAWQVIDRRRVGSIPRGELLEILLELLGPQAKPKHTHLLNHLPSRSTAVVHAREQMVTRDEFPTLAAEIANERDLVGSLGGFLREELHEAADSTVKGVGALALAWRKLDLDVSVRVPPHLLSRAGVVVERMLQQGYSAHEASTAVAALYCRRDTRSIARLWGLFDLKRSGSIPVEHFDRAMLLFSEVVTAADLPLVRAQMGFVDQDFVALREFEAALRLLVPLDGSAPQLSALKVHLTPTPD